MTAIRLAATAAAALVAGLFAQGSWAACYIVYGADKQIIYRSQLPPVDMSRPLHETVRALRPGARWCFRWTPTAASWRSTTCPARPASQHGATLVSAAENHGPRP
jgi:hypothetical protein